LLKNTEGVFFLGNKAICHPLNRLFVLKNRGFGTQFHTSKMPPTPLPHYLTITKKILIMLKRFVFIVLLLSTMMIISCKKDPTPTPTPTATGSLALLQQKILTPSCGVVGCHNSTADRTYTQHKLVLTGDIHHHLVNAPVANAQAIAAGLLQIVPRDTAKSFFFQKLIFNQSRHKYGSAMPLGADLLTAKQIEFVRQWILAGAPKTGDVADKTLLD
jgi:hypothetical protein